MQPNGALTGLIKLKVHGDGSRLRLDVGLDVPARARLDMRASRHALRRIAQDYLLIDGLRVVLHLSFLRSFFGALISPPLHNAETGRNFHHSPKSFLPKESRV